MTIFMSSGDVMRTVERLRSEMRGKRSYGKANKADEDFMGCISMLESCLSTGEVPAEQRTRVEQAIEEFRQYTDLGIIVNGRFCPIPPSQAARWDIRSGSIVSANRFPVLSRSQAMLVLTDNGNIRRQLLASGDWSWEPDTNSLVSIQFYYKRHPEKLMELSAERAEKCGLADLHRQALFDASRLLQHTNEDYGI